MSVVSGDPTILGAKAPEITAALRESLPHPICGPDDLLRAIADLLERGIIRPGPSL